MKIKYLEIENINSFKGNFKIDFEKFSNKLFLISGPTGSGKTTIIDCILASLYHKTPRLSNKIKNMLNKDSKKGKIKLIFTHNNKECEIEMIFDRDKEIKKFLKCEDTLLDKVAAITKYIEDFISLNYDQFTRAVILAQGEFDKFLKSTPKEKSEILKKIFNLEEFARVSKKIFEEYKEVISQIENLHYLIGDNSSKKLEKSKKELENELRVIKKKVEDLEKEIANKRDEYLKAKYKLDKKIKLLTLLKEKEENEKSLEEIESNFKTLKSETEKLEKELNSKKDSFLILNEKFREYEKLNVSLQEKEKNLLSLKKEKDSLEKEIENLNIQIKKLEDENKNLKSKTIDIDESLIDKKDDYQNRFLKIKSFLSQKDKKEKELKIKQKELLNFENRLQEVEKEIKELENKKENLFQKVLILKYEEDRRYLKENTPCPLCGSIHHSLENIEKVDKSIQDEFEKIEEELNNLISKRDSLKVKIEVVKTEIQNLKEEIKKFENDINSQMFEYFDRWDELKQKIDEFEKTKQKIILNETKLEGLKDNKNSKLQDLRVKEEKINDLEIEISKLNKNISNLYKGDIKKEFENLKKTIENFEKEFENKNKELKNLEDQKIKLLTTIENLEKEINNLKNEVEDDFNVDLDELKKEIDSLNEQFKKLKKEEGSIEAKVDKLNEEIKRIKELEEKLANLIRKEKILKVLNSKIGSKDGNKFVEEALSYLTYNLIEVANSFLLDLSSNRYSIDIKDEKLEFEIIDHFIGNSKRDINTLSGGESFLVSLSLSLALSEVSKNAISLESMFLDEGFGTLDKDSLSEVLSLLQSLIVGDKMIGIISHVEMLQNELPDKIIIHKKGNGESVIIN